MTPRSVTILNEQGDVTIVWDESEDAKMAEIIRKKMDEGITFFIVEPRFFGLLPPKRTALANVDEALKHRAIAVRDDDFGRFVESGSGQAVKTPEQSVSTRKQSDDAEEIARNQSVGVKPMRGG